MEEKEIPRLKVVFMGTPEFAVASLQALTESRHRVVGVVTAPDRPTGRGLQLTASAVKQYATAHNLPVLQPEKLRDGLFLEQLRQWQADLFVVVAFRMLPREVWAMPRLGTFNLHAALLPQYRGAAPINWAIINGEKETGVTTFMINERIDEGQILLQARTPIADDDNAGTLHDRLATLGQRLVIQTVDGLASGTLTPQAQSTEGLLLKPAPKIFKPGCEIQWDSRGQSVVNFVRGLSPYPAALMRMTDSRGVEQYFKVYQVAFEPVDGSVGEGAEYAVGTLLSDGKKYLKVKVQDGFIHILNLQMNGKRKNFIADFLRGFNINSCKVIM